MTSIKRIHSYSEWEQACYFEIASVILSASKKKNIALSGGSTPIPVYQRIGKLLKTLPESKIKNIRFFVVDERDVSIESTQSNSSMILNTIGRNLVVPFDPAKHSPESYYQHMCQEIEGTGAFDLIVLGCGDDGHTASLFPDTLLLKEKSNSFMENKLPSGELRYSMTFSLINSAKKKVVFVNNNKEKLKYFGSVTLNAGAYPIHQVLSTPNTEVIIHEEL
jgi:6-phosphogluconolactonase